jgi:RNA polymerase sigma-70 factor (ECF subfamily)
MLYAQARTPARRGGDGTYIPFSEQNPSCWDSPRIAEAEALLTEAVRKARVGPLQLEAAIQSAHVNARLSGVPDDPAVSLLYETLVRITPNLGIRVAHAVALSKTEGAARGIELLDAIKSTAPEDYQPYWSARAHLLELVGRRDEACQAYDRAGGLTEDDGVRRWLLAKKKALEDTTSKPDPIRSVV